MENDDDGFARSAASSASSDAGDAAPWGAADPNQGPKPERRDSDAGARRSGASSPRGQPEPEKSNSYNWGQPAPKADTPRSEASQPGGSPWDRVPAEPSQGQLSARSRSSRTSRQGRESPAAVAPEPVPVRYDLNDDDGWGQQSRNNTVAVTNTNIVHSDGNSSYHYSSSVQQVNNSNTVVLSSGDDQYNVVVSKRGNAFRMDF